LWGSLVDGSLVFSLWCIVILLLLCCGSRGSRFVSRIDLRMLLRFCVSCVSGLGRWGWCGCGEESAARWNCVWCVVRLK